MLEKIDHIGIAVRSVEASSVLYRDVLGLAYEGTEVVESQGVKVAFFRLGEAKIELLEPLHEESPIARFLEKKGEGIHHIALGCDDIEAWRARMEEAGVRLLSEEPIDGAHGKLITFMHPADTGRVLLELTQRRQQP
ncbi:methylmalonyl-CoA epimerase [Lujinxingia litoralis]|uniref:Methylmalonyl-CoA epimerase n=1 Tax=Lujinxingia litoralis TaxID=2211119 RepID=A0A328C2Z3_9DELT|nr:methylmalonyl-CoA epimerase [Lujinxingia litoralis]RAL20157.1 methylmalonyl-CoA epimerase [Lujinxingia litoralis]